MPPGRSCCLLPDLRADQKYRLICRIEPRRHPNRACPVLSVDDSNRYGSSPQDSQFSALTKTGCSQTLKAASAEFPIDRQVPSIDRFCPAKGGRISHAVRGVWGVSPPFGVYQLRKNRCSKKPGSASTMSVHRLFQAVALVVVN